ncbi:hypothetical protein [Methylobacterium sp. WL120]|uniref:hypothetical protein n=1 Tax=Methylobacterium sp. WL120 TaxID=2603887 RepID=UPI0011C9F2D2|nr:hypothetical protein [Methylobacterium sp. WL120]TXM53966.1 hypothetical protein FV229_26705 [Methylobacterium sp. WL120]
MNTSIRFPRPTRRLLLAAAVSAILIRPACADALSDGRFRAEVAAVLRAMLPGAEILPDPDPKQILFGGSTIALTNLYPRVAPLAGDARRRLIEAHLATALKAVNAPPSTGEPSLAAVRTQLRVQLLPREILRQVPDLATRTFSETLVVAYVIDGTDRMRYLTRSMLDGWGVGAGAIPTAIEALALANLAEASKDAAFALAVADGTPIFVMTSEDDNYDAARLMLPSYLDRVRSALKAEAVTVAIPTRDLLMAWPADSKARAGFAA